MARLTKIMREIAGATVTVGVHEGAGAYPDGTEVVEVALWTEFGTQFMPERSWLRSAVDENQSLIEGWREELLSQVIAETMTLPKALETLGFRMQTLVQNKIRSNVPPPLAPSTLAAKRAHGAGDATLIDTTLLLRSVSFKVNL